jgi:hypothetical protein
MRSAGAEFAQTRSLLARVPNYRLHWQPHPTSWPLGELAGHLAMFPAWVPALVGASGLDVLAPDAPSLLHAPYDREGLLETFDFHAEAARSALLTLDPERLKDTWTQLSSVGSTHPACLGPTGRMKWVQTALESIPRYRP